MAWDGGEAEQELVGVGSDTAVRHYTSGKLNIT